MCAQVGTKDGSHWTPLHRVAALKGNAKVAKALIDAGADVNGRDSSQTTVLMVGGHCCKYGETSFCNLAGSCISVRVQFAASCFKWPQGFGQTSPQKWSQPSGEEPGARTALL